MEISKNQQEDNLPSSTFLMGTCKEEPCTASDQSSLFSILSYSPGNDIQFRECVDLMSDLHLSFASASSDLSYQEIQEKLKELLKENIELKEVLQQNNKNMKTQFQTLMNWQQQINLVHNDHRKKFEESRILIEELRVQNCELTDNLLELEKKFASHNDCQQMKLKVEELTSKIQDAEGDKQAISAELERQQVICIHLEERVREMTGDYEQLETNYQQLEVDKRELTALNNDLQTRLMKMCCKQGVENDSYPIVTEEHGYTVVHPGSSGFSVGDDTSIRGALLRLHEEQAKNARLTQQLAEEQLQVLQMKKTLQEKDNLLQQFEKQLNMNNPDHPGSENLALPPSGQPGGYKVIMSSSGQSGKTCQQGGHQLLLVCGQKMDMANSVLEKSGARSADLDSLLSVSQHRLQNLDLYSSADIELLKQEITKLQVRFEEEKSFRSEDRKQLLEVQQQFTQLFDDYQDLLQSIESRQKEQNDLGEEGEAWIELEKRKHQEESDAITAKLVHTEELLANQKKETMKMKSEIEQMKVQVEKLPILEAQVELSNQDYNQEKEGHRSTKEELERLKEDLLALQNHNQELMDEINVYAKSQVMHLQKSLHKNESYLSGNTRHSRHKGRDKHQSLHNRKHHEKRIEVKTGAADFNITEGELRGRSRNPLGNGDQAELPEQHAFICPRCEMRFMDYQALQNHVEECLSKDDHFL
ncbi:optineurin-like [Limulus polyphemus]|uniref:Optineurin-like n=1 Tax=Limulus polyphemus TaxID=6850 RepID=A0ABM1BM17_LIMPO|nr:optineurin-like [Limulus polyphemus]XP_013784711.1 optineurin-like [Limulus polyphemus]XP_022252877.1 optineurin-like [Limulus polyphemus]